VKTLTAAGFAMKNLSVVGKGYHSDEKVVGFYNAGDRIKFWGSHGAFWGGFWGLFFGGLFLAAPVAGPVVVLGFLATIIVSAIENALVVGGVAALAAALYSIGVPKDSVVQYESDIKADSFLSWRGARPKRSLAPRRSSARPILRDLMSIAIRTLSRCRRLGSPPSPESGAVAHWRSRRFATSCVS
jgi:hypothetical protein